MGSVLGRRGTLVLALVVLGVACGGSVGGGGFDADVARQLDAAVGMWVDDAVGGVVARVEAPGGQQTLARGPGGLEAHRELAGDEAFRIASITKLFTAVVALQLAEAGAVALDARVAEVLPERTRLLEYGEEITLRQLLGHTGGLSEPDLDRYVADALEYVDVDDGVAVITCDDVALLDLVAYVPGDAAFAPGTDWAYSNAGYLLAGEVIEAVTGQPLAQVYRERILEPLDMDDTWLDCHEEPRGELAGGIHPPGADGIVLPGQGDDPFDVTDLERDAWAAGGLVSTAEDLAVFAGALFTGALFDDDASLVAMLEPGPRRGYGLGVQLDSEAGRDVVGHSGSLLGYHTYLTYDLDRDVAVVVLSNQTLDPPSNPLARRVASELRAVMNQHSRGG